VPPPVRGLGRRGGERERRRQRHARPNDVTIPAAERVDTTTAGAAVTSAVAATVCGQGTRARMA
jgi:hypothetical protein